MLEISEINITPLKAQGSLLGFAQFVLNGEFFLGGVAIHSDLQSRGCRLVYPTKKLRNGEEVPLFHPITKAAADKVQKAVSSEWEQLFQ